MFCLIRSGLWSPWGLLVCTRSVFWTGKGPKQVTKTSTHTHTHTHTTVLFWPWLYKLLTWFPSVCTADGSCPEWLFVLDYLLNPSCYEMIPPITAVHPHIHKRSHTHLRQLCPTFRHLSWPCLYQSNPPLSGRIIEFQESRIIYQNIYAVYLRMCSCLFS